MTPPLSFPCDAAEAPFITGTIPAQVSYCRCADLTGFVSLACF